MEIVTTQYKRCDLVKTIGRIDSSSAPKFADALNSITDDNRFRIVIDMSELEFLSSAGLRVLIATQKICKRYNRGEVILAALPKNIFAALELTGFTDLFKIFDDDLSAVGHF
ncbi:MAG: STAS domain-containing protein [Anaerolineaceae bacterium]|nr:STAS domain-containing protein [Anaerolineaceae bacterium]